MNACPNCNAPIKDSFFGKNSAISSNIIDTINKYAHDPKELYCNSCYHKVLDNAIYAIEKIVSDCERELYEAINIIPLITIPSPSNWNFKTVGMVTAQTTTGTGAITEFTSSFTDLLGMQSNRTSNKLKAGEDACSFLLRKKASELNCNAVIGVDVDYAEVGGDRGMLMVCMAGTAVNVIDVDVFSTDISTKLERITGVKTALSIALLDRKLIKSEIG